MAIMHFKDKASATFEVKCIRYPSLKSFLYRRLNCNPYMTNWMAF